MLFSKRFLLLAVAICAALQVASLATRTIRPAQPTIPVSLEGSFQPGGWYAGEKFANAIDVRAWGSWSGSDENLGSIKIGPFPAPRILRFGIGGYPNTPGNSLHVERGDSSDRIEIKRGGVGERWQIVDFELPPEWTGHPIQLVATDNAKAIGGWLAVSEPIRGGRGDGNNALLNTAAAFSHNSLLLGLHLQAALSWLGRRRWFAPQWLPLIAGGAVAAAAYGVFWCYFAHVLAGKIVSAALLVFAAAQAWRLAPVSRADSDTRTAALLMLAVGAFHLSLLHVFPSSLSFDDLAANRYRERMPSDNVLPYDLASRLYRGLSPINPAAEWQSSDRPPLQSGWELLTWGTMAALGSPDHDASGTAAVWFQLLWVPVVYGLLRTLRLERSRAAAWTAIMALSGFYAQNTIFTWPKLCAAALVCGAFALWVLPPDGKRSPRPCITGAVLAALGWLCHGGVAFAFLALAPWVLWRVLRGEWRCWLLASITFILLATPWICYQRFYEPPGNRLLKWHLGGQEQRDARGVGETIRDGYRALSWQEIKARKLLNLEIQVSGHWRLLGDFSAKNAKFRREQEFFLTARTLTWWLTGVVLVGFALFRSAARRQLAEVGRSHLALLAWVVGTIVIWCLLMFSGANAVIHQGSYPPVLVMLVLLSAWCETAGRWWIVVVALLQTATLATTYGSNEIVHGPPVGWPFVAISALGLAMFVIAAFLRPKWPAVFSVLSDQRPIIPPETMTLEGTTSTLRAGPTGPACQNRTPDKEMTASNAPALRPWWEKPRILAGFVLLCAVLLALRKPWALHTPQFWAEDGEIFMKQDDAMGAAAFFVPYNGYLHLLPRLIAWTASHTADVAWWPAIYNGFAYALSVAVFARMASRRVELPAKPWLMLAFVLTVGTGEVLINVTNLQWITAFFLILHLFMAPATNWAQRLGDLLILLVVGFNGPFAIVLAPLFAWRAWRERRLDHFLALAAIGTCAAVTTWLVLHGAGGLSLHTGSEPCRPLMGLSVTGSRLITWTVLGPSPVKSWPIPVHAVLGVVVIGAILIRALRADPRRPVRVMIVAAFVLITLACSYRVRADTWEDDNLVNGDRYFYISRVLLAWLVILECNASSRVVRNLARGACILGVLMHLPHFMLPSPTDYKWAEHCDPIRRGVPANIYTLPEGWFIEYTGRPQKR